MIRRLFAIGLVAASALVARSASACDCPMEPPVEIALEKASAVVHVRVAKISDYQTWHDGGSVGTNGDRTLRLAVIRSWRGEIAPNTTFDLATEGHDCEHTFQKTGEEHVLYLHKRDGAWHVITCGRSVQMGVGASRNGESEVALLDKVASKNAARWGGTAAASSSAPAPPPPTATSAPTSAPSSSSPPAPTTRAGGCAGCSAVDGDTAPMAGSVAMLFALALVLRMRTSLSRQPSRR